MRVSWIAAMLATTALFPAGSAVAGGFGNRLQSTVGTGMAFSGAGTSSYGLSGMFWNPASVNLADGFMTDSNYTLVVPTSDLSALSGTSPGLLGLGSSSGDVGIDALIPGSYGAYRINPDWAIGVSVNAPFGLATKADTPWAGQNLAITSKAAVIDVAAVVGYTFNDWINVAVGPRLVYGTAKFSRDISPAPGIQYGILQNLEDTGFGFTAGVTIKPWAGGEVALGYRSAVRLALEGDISLDAGPIRSADVKGNVTLPDQLTLSMKQQVDSQWAMLGSIEWKNWSRVQDVPFIIQGGPAGGNEVTRLTFRYKDGWNFALGAEYRWDDRLTLRGGVAYEISPVQDQDRDPSIPDSDRFWVSTGATYALTDRWAVKAGYSHAFMKNASIRVGPGTGHPDSGSLFGQTLIAEADSAIDVVSVGFTYKFGGTTTAAALPQSSAPAN